ncbi:MAG: translation initiation factor IF-3 [Caldilineaceae bacterium]
MKPAAGCYHNFRFEQGDYLIRRSTFRPPQQDNTRVNDGIRAREIRVIGADGEQLGIMTVPEALRIADEKELDLVEVAPNSTPPVCRLMDYGKYLYEKQKRDRESRKSQKQIEIKEVRLRPKTDEHDIQVVLTKIRKFAKEGAKIRVRMRFRGREIYHPEVAQEIMQRIATDVGDVVTVEARPTLDGRSMVMVLAPT